MSGSTPSDLAVAFRTLARREQEALGDAPPSSVGPLVGELRSHVDAAARALGTDADADAVATELLARRPDDWDEQTLAELRRIALDAGAVLRRIAALTENDTASG